MPTPESEAAFARLTEARALLNDISTELNIASGGRGTSTGNARYRQLQEQWDAAFRAFKVATEQFSTIVQRIHENRQETSDWNYTISNPGQS